MVGWALRRVVAGRGLLGNSWEPLSSLAFQYARGVIVTCDKSIFCALWLSIT